MLDRPLDRRLAAASACTKPVETLEFREDFRLGPAVSYRRMKPLPLAAACAAVLTVLAGCNRSPSGPTPGLSNPPPAAPVVTLAGVTVTGNNALTEVGQTTTLIASAAFSDGTTKTVTSDVVWTSQEPSALAVSPAGVVTALRFGSSTISARYFGKTATLRVTVTPPGTFVANGRVKEPGLGGLPGVVLQEEGSGLVVTTGQSGSFTVGGLQNGRFRVDKDGFESITFTAKPNGYDDVGLQRVIRISAGSSVDVNLAPHDMEYATGDGARCYPCRLIRIVSAESGRLQLHVAWKETHATLNIWAGGQFFAGSSVGPAEAAADVPFGPGELIVYVGMKAPVEYYAPFTMTTAVVK